MHIAIFHYHLNPGGVTRIIESQVAGIKKIYPNTNITVIAGHCENEEYYNALDVNVIVDPVFNYLFDREFKAGELSKIYNITYAKLKAIVSESTILHVHNINLGKNPIVTLAVNALLNEGYSVVNHAHDFAEDRPVNMAYLQKIIETEFGKSLNSIMYPASDKYIIGVLNRFDYDRVINIGVNIRRVFLFPNPVYVPLNEAPHKPTNRNKIISEFDIAPDKTIITYPVRIIKRKNIGELILLSALYSNIQVLVTLPPRNPVEIELYKKWKEFCNKNNIAIIFEAGERVNFIDIISGSDYCITTSIQEGFGMAYLEPWIIGTPVIGRDIEYITTDLKTEGVQFPFLYNGIYFNGNCEFSEMETKEQQAFITNILAGNITVSDFEKSNKVFENFPPKVSEVTVNENRETIIKNFSVEEYAKRIFNAYKTLPQ